MELIIYFFISWRKKEVWKDYTTVQRFGVANIYHLCCIYLIKNTIQSILLWNITGISNIAEVM